MAKGQGRTHHFTELFLGSKLHLSRYHGQPQKLHVGFKSPTMIPQQNERTDKNFITKKKIK